MRVIICGPRNFNDYNFLVKKLHKIFKQLADEGLISAYITKTNIEIVSGAATGADALGEVFADSYEFPLKQFPAKWEDLSAKPCLVKYNEFGRPYNALAGHNRNKKMAEYASKDNGVCIAVWQGTSGTKNMIETAEAYGLRIFKIIPE